MSELLDTVKARKLAYYGHTMRKQGSCLEKEIMQGTMPGARRRGRPRIAWMDNIKTWTGLPVKVQVASRGVARESRGRQLPPKAAALEHKSGTKQPKNNL